MPITRSELMQFLDDLEERNLSLMKAIEEDTVEFEEMLQVTGEERHLQRDLKRVNENITEIEKKLSERRSKLHKMQNMLDSTNNSPAKASPKKAVKSTKEAEEQAKPGFH